MNGDTQFASGPSARPFLGPVLPGEPSQPCPELLTEEEAVRYLRLDTINIADHSATIRRSLRGDLETIALKALEKDPARRYQSAAILSEDIHRYLTSQPVVARPPSAAYQLRKLVDLADQLPESRIIFSSCLIRMSRPSTQLGRYLVASRRAARW